MRALDVSNSMPDNSSSVLDVETRARCSQGSSNAAIYEMVTRALQRHGISGGRIVDVGCGEGHLYPYVQGRFQEYVGVDVVRYDRFPAEGEFVKMDLDQDSLPLPGNGADVVVAVETIEHLENPRHFMRQLVRLAKPDGWVIVTTPNQLALLSILSLIVKHRFGAFQDVHYPAHISALLEIDLTRIATESGVSDLEFEYSLCGRIPGTPLSYPQFLSRIFPRALSDNLLLAGRKK